MTDLPRPTEGRRRRLLAGLVVNGFAQAACTAGHALVVNAAFNRLFGASSQFTLETAASYGAVLVAVPGALGILRALERTTSERLGQDYGADVRLAVYDRMTALAPRALQKKAQGSIMLRFVGDLSALQKWVTYGLARITVASTTVAGSLAALGLINPLLGVTLAIVLFAGVALTATRGAPLRVASLNARRARSTLAANVNEKISSMAVVQAFGRIDSERTRMQSDGRRLVESTVGKARVVGQLRGGCGHDRGWASAVTATGSCARPGVLARLPREHRQDRALPGASHPCD
jgi:ABC-type multidrug transport system fused ATPase/permease subunit